MSTPPAKHSKGPAYRTKPCRAYHAGNCRFGDACNFRHDLAQTTSANVLPAFNGPSHNSGESSLPNMVMATTVASPRIQGVNQTDPQATSPNPSRPARPKRGEIPCHAWKAGNCAKGEKCWFGHDPEIQAAEQRRREVAARRAWEVAQRREREKALRAALEAEAKLQAQLERDRAARVQAERLAEQRRREEEAQRRAEEQAEASRRAEEERERLAREEAARQAERRRMEEARLAEVARQDAAKTSQVVVLGSIVTFGAGLDIRGIVTGFEACTIQVRGLPRDATPQEIQELFTQQGIDSARLLIESIRPVQGGKLEATVVTEAEYGQVLAAGLNDLEFREERLTFEFGVYNAAGGMGASKAQDADVLTISWRAPSIRWIAIYTDLDVAREKARTLNGRIFRERRLKVEMNTPPPGRALLYFQRESIKIRGLPPDTSYEEVMDFTGAVSCRQLPWRAGPYLLESALERLRQDLERAAPRALQTFERTSQTIGTDGTVSVRARFATPEDAQKAHDSLETRKLEYMNDMKPWLKLPTPLAYTLVIPASQYHAQRRQWAELAASVKDRKACSLNIHEQTDRGIARIRLLGSVKAAVGALKVRVETLAAGEKADGWHFSIAHADRPFARSVFVETGAFLRGDRLRQLKVYGEPAAVEAAREMVKNELARLAVQERTAHLPRQAVGFFLRHGLSELRAIVGDDNAKLDVATQVITFSGGDEAQRVFNRLLEQARTTSLPASSRPEHGACPICFDDIIAPVLLGCAHAYCTACLRHYVLSALDSDDFPLVCMGDEGRCAVPVALPTIERFLPPAPFHRLAEVAFAAHVAKRPAEFVYCKTPDCTQVYRAAGAGAPAVLQCPACFAEVCPACQDEGHRGMSCAELRQDRAAEEWIRAQGGRVKRCPQCRVPIEKTEGCNHMSCRCGAHVCWTCLGVFEAGAIYDHMQAAHGSIYAGEPAGNPLQGVDYAEQEEAWRVARELRAAALEREERQRAEARLAQERFRAANLQREAQVEARLAEARRAIERARVVREEMEAQLRRREGARREADLDQNRGWCTIM